jgi:hypothetical protein
MMGTTTTTGQFGQPLAGRPTIGKNVGREGPEGERGRLKRPGSVRRRGAPSPILWGFPGPPNPVPGAIHHAAEAAALPAIEAAYRKARPKAELVLIDSDYFAARNGEIHCVTQVLPQVESASVYGTGRDGSAPNETSHTLAKRELPAGPSTSNTTT